MNRYLIAQIRRQQILDCLIQNPGAKWPDLLRAIDGRTPSDCSSLENSIRVMAGWGEIRYEEGAMRGQRSYYALKSTTRSAESIQAEMRESIRMKRLEREKIRPVQPVHSREHRYIGGKYTHNASSLPPLMHQGGQGAIRPSFGIQSSAGALE